MVEDDALFVGQRVSVGGYIGTVKYVGTVPPTEGDWLGIEWDDPNRGKHNGSKDGVTYFTCRSETGGSFVRPQKVTKGVSLSEALLERYASFECKHGSVPGEELYFVDPETSQKTLIETIGMEKVQKQFENLLNLNVVGLRDNCVSSAGEDGFLSKRAPNIEDLDLSKNLFHDWTEVGKVCCQLSKLLQLNMSQNILEIPREPEILAPNFASLRTVILNRCGLKWSEVTLCLKMWLQIVELHLESNSIEEITELSADQFAQLEVLNLSGNCIKHWKHILCLSKVPRLQELVLNNCWLDEISLTEDDFSSLQQLFLSNNRFETPGLFNQLNHLRNLDALMFRSNPVLSEETADTIRQVIIAKIGRLRMLNRSEVSEIERQGAEIDYLKNNGRYWKESGGHQDPEKNQPSDGFLRDHPRYNELIARHGAREDAEFFIKSTALKTNLLDVHIVVPDKSEIKPILKKLPSSMTVGALKFLISRLTKIPIKSQGLVYVCHYNKNHVVQMDKDTETLYYISLESGDTVEVHQRNSYRKQIRTSWGSKKPAS